MTAEKKKGRIREEQLADLLGSVVTPIQITSEIAEEIATAVQNSDAEGERHRVETVARLDQRRRTAMAKLDRGYDDFVSGKISQEFWTRKSQERAAEVQVADSERARVMQPKPCATATAAI